MGKIDDFLKGFLPDGDASEKWVVWKHITQGKTHCPDCLVMDKCWFARKSSPNAPLHPYCHCVKIPIPYDQVLAHAEATSAYSKYDPYLFNRDKRYPHSKEKMFESWGYTIEDAEWLQKEVEEQALHKYISGDYTLGKLNDKGQRINIRIELERKSGSGSVSFLSGWMVQPNGQIKLNTPYGGK